VDIGLHFIALNAQGAPVDTDGDYVPDYLEDINGNGIQDGGEHSHTSATTDNDGDGLTNTQEVTLFGYVPFKSDSDGDGIPDGNEDYDGDLLTDKAELNTYGSDPKVLNSKHSSVSDFDWFHAAIFGNNFTPATLCCLSFPGGNIQITLNGGDGIYDLFFRPDLNSARMLYALGPPTRLDPQTQPQTFLQIAPGTPTGFFTAGRTRHPNGTLWDDDLDGVDNATEGSMLKSSPDTPDTDGDDYSDGPNMPGALAPSGRPWKGNNDAFPTVQAAWRDTDGDGMPDELAMGLDPKGLVQDTDSDNDGIPDAQETPSGRTDPKVVPVRWFVNANFVPPGGVTPDGSRDLPYLTIQAALNAVNGDYQVIEVAPGTYFTANLDFRGFKAQLRSLKGPDLTIIDGTGAGNVRALVLDSANENEAVFVAGFTIRNAQGGGIVCQNGASPTFINCIITGNGTGTSGNGGGVLCQNASSPRFINCKIHGNTASGGSGGGVYAQDTSAPKFSNCTFSDNAHAANVGQINAQNTAKIALNSCIVWDVAPSGAELVNGGSATITVSYSDVRGWIGSGRSGLLNIDQNPTFEADGSRRLLRTSPCKDRGNTFGLFGFTGYRLYSTNDFDAEARLQDSTANIIFNADIGADEFVYRLPFAFDINNFSQVDEASGVVYLGTVTVGPEQHAKIAVIDDELKDTMYIYELNQAGDGIAVATAVNITHPTAIGSGVMNADVNDLEGITYDDVNRYLYIITSQTKRNQYRDVDSIPTDPFVDPPSNDYDRRRTILMRLQLDTSFNPIPSAGAPTRTVWEADSLAVPFNTDVEENNRQNNGLARYLRNQFDFVGSRYGQLNINSGVMIAWNTVPKFGTPVNGTTYAAGNQLPYDGGGPNATAGTVLNNFGASGNTTHNLLTANQTYYYRIWAYDAQRNYLPLFKDGRAVNNGIPTIYINEFELAGGTETIEFYNPAPVQVNIAGWFLSDTPATLNRYPLPSPFNIPARGVAAESGHTTVFSYNDDNSEHIHFTFSDGTTQLEFWNIRDPDSVNPGTEGRAWDGGPRGAVPVGDYESCVFRVTAPVSPYPPTYNPSTVNDTHGRRTFDVVPASPMGSIYLVWNNIGLVPAAWIYSPKQHDNHSINLEALARRSGTEWIIGLRSPLSGSETETSDYFRHRNRLNGNAFYVRVNNEGQFLPAGGWTAVAAGLGTAQQLNLNGQGFRSIEWCPNGLLNGAGTPVQRYLIIGGPANGGPLEKEKVGEKFSLYSWTGNAGDAPQRLIEDLAPYAVRPEGVHVILVNGQWRIMFAEDRFMGTAYARRNAIHWPVSIAGPVL
jgi:parallel beta-helix repeat protein